MTDRRRVGVLMGGLSSEREISLLTGNGVYNALKSGGYDVVALDWKQGVPLPELVTQVDVVWNALHGPLGEDGAIQGFLECLGIPYTGSGVTASAIGMDKVWTKKAFQEGDVSTPAWTVYGEHIRSLPWEKTVIKPSQEGSSVGISIVSTWEGFEEGVAHCRQFPGEVLLEEFIAGDEIHVGMLNGEVMGSVEVRPGKEFYDFEAKYKRNDTVYLCPPEVDTEKVKRAEAVAKEAYECIGCVAHARVDLRVSPDGTPYVMEVNTLPGMTATSLMPKIAAGQGMTYLQLCEAILATATTSGHQSK